MNKQRTLSRAIGVLLALLMLLPLPAIAEEAAPNDVEDMLKSMTLEQKVGQMMIVSFRTWKDSNVEDAPSVDVTVLNDDIRDTLQKGLFGGVLLFAQNCADAEQTLRLVADMQAVNQAAGGLPLLVSTDQEGGSVARLGFGTPGPGSMALTASGDPKNATTMAAIYGEELRLLGIHADFAPVVDVNNNASNPVIGVRSFSDTPEVAAVYGAAYLKGLHSAGTMASLKHFPGHGNTDTDSHTGFPCVNSTYEELSRTELIPFQLAIDAGADMIMTAHIQYPEIEKGTYTSTTTQQQVYLPATMSKTILTDILRRDMGFTGVVVSDALDMAAISENFAIEDVLRMTINAGVDLLILPPTFTSQQTAQMRDIVKQAAKLVEAGEIDAARVDESVRRILTLKQKYGILDKNDFTVTDEQVQAAVAGVGSAAHRQTAYGFSQKALTLLKNENEAFPVKLQAGQKAFILLSSSAASRVATVELVQQLLAAQNALPSDAAITSLVNTKENEAECIAAAMEADAVILVSRVYNAAGLNPNTNDGFSTAVFDKIIEARHEAGKTVIVVSCQLPYDAARFPKADAILLTYGSAVMRALPPETRAGSGYVPNLAAGLCACFGQGEATGRLPVDLPALNESYALTKTIFCRAGERLTAVGNE